MSKVKSLKLTEGTRVGNYEIIKPLGRGWEGEVYHVKEVPTEAHRAMKILIRDRDTSFREYIHTAWFFEQLSCTGSVARYYHFGQWFLKDDDGLFYLIFEMLDGVIFKEYIQKKIHINSFPLIERLNLLKKIIEKIMAIHKIGYAVGDFSQGDNIIILKNSNEPIFCDLDPGKPDYPNNDFINDIKELKFITDLIFKDKTKEKSLLSELINKYSDKKNSNKILTNLYEEIASYTV